MSTALTPRPLIGLGMASLVLGTIALLLAFFPVLGIPIAACGLVFGILGLVLARRAVGARLRWTLMGLAVSSAALALNIALAYAPAGYDWRGRNPPPLWRQPADRPQVPAPQR